MDELENLKLLNDCLTGRRLRVVMTTHGREAPRSVRNEMPDRTLLDTLMSAMAGYEFLGDADVSFPRRRESRSETLDTRLRGCDSV